MEKIWKQIEDMSRSTKAIAVPVVPDSQGTYTNLFDLHALILQRVNHSGSMDKNLKNAGYVLLMFYNLYEGKSRSDFETKLCERFGLLVKMPLLKSDRYNTQWYLSFHIFSFFFVVVNIIASSFPFPMLVLSKKYFVAYYIL